jgi:4-hydroxy-tetrahydrodipicolinate reductase
LADGRTRVVVSGAAGQMGATVCAAVLGADDLELVGAVDPGFGPTGDGARVEAGLPDGIPRFARLDEGLPAGSVDVVVDFTNPGAVLGNIRTCIQRGVAAVVGTTGLATADLQAVGREASASGVPVLVAPNFALGAVLMMRFAAEAAAFLDACEVVELHHDRKLDAPSGTAKRTGILVEEVWRERGIERTVPLHSVRLPGLVAHQEVIFGGLGQTLTIRHDSISRESFMPGVLLAVRRIGSVKGLVIGLENIL